MIARTSFTTRFARLGILLVVLPLVSCGKSEPLEPSGRAAALDDQIDWSAASLIAVQDRGRYKTLDSFARESFAAMTGREHLPGLSPVASLLEWEFNRDAYADEPLIKVREKAVRMRLAGHLDAERRAELLESRHFTPREFDDERLNAQIREMETHNIMRSALNRVRGAQAIAQRLDQFLTFVPQPGGDDVAPWGTAGQVEGNLTLEQMAQLGLTRATISPHAMSPMPEFSADDALRITVDWKLLKKAWLGGDAAGTQKYLDRLAAFLPTLAGPGVYPSVAQRAAEARYYSFGKFTWGWLVYFLALLFALPALVTRWRWAWGTAFALMLVALSIHAYGVGLRWSILGRIPVANMFEAVVASAWMGIAVALLIEIFQRTRILLVAAAATGFLGLVMGSFVLPGAELGTIPAILDDIQLRLHTVMIIAAYALVYLAAVIAVIYLIGYYAVMLGRKFQRQAGTGLDDGSGLGMGLGFVQQRPILAGATPGDEADQSLPQWLNDFDWAHLIILNMVFLLLFVGGIILGAWWADYSWGRPWGWDPKEVFALNTWLVYAILLHVRFVVRNRGLWTAWLSIAGCVMMAFNWFFVNFYIASVHSYA